MLNPGKSHSISGAQNEGLQYSKGDFTKAGLNRVFNVVVLQAHGRKDMRERKAHTLHPEG